MGREPLQDLGEAEWNAPWSFPDRGSGGEISGAVREAVLDYLGDGDVPYQLAVFANSVDLLYRLRDAGIDADVVAGHSLGEYAAAHAAGSLTSGTVCASLPRGTA